MGASTALWRRGCSTTSRTSSRRSASCAGCFVPTAGSSLLRAATRNLGELWELVGECGAPAGGFTVENAEGTLLRHFATVERRDVRGTVTFPDRETAHRHISACPTRGELADRLPVFDRPLVASRHVAVFVCEQ